MMNKKLLSINSFFVAISFSAIAMDKSVVRKVRKASRPLVSSSAFGNLEYASWSVEDNGREEFRKKSNSRIFIQDRSKERTQNMQNRKEQVQAVAFPEYKPREKTANHVTVRRKRIIVLNPEESTQRAFKKTQAEIERKMLDFNFAEPHKPNIPIHTKIQFDDRINEGDGESIKKLLRTHKDELQSYYPASILIDYRNGFISLSDFEIDKKRFGTTISLEKYNQIIQKLNYSDVITRHEFNQAINAGNVSKIIKMCNDNQSLREDYLPANFLDGVFNHFRIEEKDFFVDKARIHSDINMDAFKKVALEIAIEGGNIAFEESFKRSNINPQIA